MDDFLTKFFPTVERNKNRVSSSDSDYCKYNNQGLQAFTSSLYLAALVASFFASFTTRLLGRKITMLIAGLSFLCGATLNAAAQDLAMLILGRILLGVGVGFANQVELLSSLHKQTNLRQMNSFCIYCILEAFFFNNVRPRDDGLMTVGGFLLFLNVGFLIFFLGPLFCEQLTTTTTTTNTGGAALLVGNGTSQTARRAQHHVPACHNHWHSVCQSDQLRHQQGDTMGLATLARISCCACHLSHIGRSDLP